MTHSIEWKGRSARMDGDLYEVQHLSPNVWVANVNWSQIGEWRTTEQDAKDSCEAEYRRRLAARNVDEQFAEPLHSYVQPDIAFSGLNPPDPFPEDRQLPEGSFAGPMVPAPAPAALTNIEDLFDALGTYQRAQQKAGFDYNKHEAAREAFKEAIGPLANHIDWSDKP